MSSSYYDREFGEIPVKQSAQTQYVRLKIGDDGTLTATVPSGGSPHMLAELLDESRDELRTLLSDSRPKRSGYYEGQKIGDYFTLHYEVHSQKSLRYFTRDGLITIFHPAGMAVDDRNVQGTTTRALKHALKRLASIHLTRRIRELADEHGFEYAGVEFANPRGRWGSCSQEGKIRLNVALLTLPRRLSDYVIVHELAHTIHLNHSREFWSEVKRVFPDYRERREALKQHSPRL